MGVKSKLSNIKIGGKKSDKQEKEKIYILQIFMMRERRSTNFIMIILQ